MNIFTLGFLAVMILVEDASTVAINGPQGGVDHLSGQRPARQEFSTFKDSGPAFDLYIQSLHHLMRRNQSDLLSYYQIAGIHGRPFIAWDRVEGDYQAGYCPHGSILFPPWHRPYLALVEQTLWDYAQQLASRYPLSQRSQYQEAARTFRMPYWDWATNPAMPDLTNTPNITINTPNGPDNCTNPLYQYEFHPQPSSSDFPPGERLSAYTHTIRYPNAKGESQPNLSNKQLIANGNSLHTLTYQLLVQQSDYAPFSNTGFTGSRGRLYSSVENIHNSIHSLIGNGGHMSFVPYSAFDPIFWLHHVNVDRLFAIWQALYPNSYVTPQANPFGTYTDAPGSSEDINTPLTPFRSDGEGTLYTSATARTTRQFGYTYPEITDWHVNATQLTLDVRTKLNALYNPTGSITRRSSQSEHDYAIPMTANGADRQWFVNIRVNKSVLSQSFFIHFFLGNVSSSSADWSFAPNLVASHSVLVSTNQSFADATSYGQIPLTHALLSYPTTANLDPANVVPFLQEKLCWRLQAFDDQAVDIATVKDLKLYVAARTVQQTEATDQFPIYGPTTAYRDVTRSKPGGLKDGDCL